MAPAIKFLHAADLHLDRVIDGLAEIPAHLKSTLASAAYQAAENVFTLALAERVDFVLLAGDVVDLEHGGPRAATFLQAHFERLAERNVPVYWCSGVADQLDRWQAIAELPANVTLLSSHTFERHPITKQGKPLATLFGAGHYGSRNYFAELNISTDEVFPIVLTHLPAGELSEALPVRYWALGGEHSGRVIERGGSTVVYPGTPQARSPDEIGRHSCALVHVDSASRVRVEPHSTDVVRWLPQHILFAESANDDEIRSVFADRALQILGEVPEQLGLVTWTVESTGEFAPRLHTDAWRHAILQWLRAEFGSGAKGLWSLDIEFADQRPMPREWFEEDTMLGDYLQTVQRLQADAEQPMNLHAYMPATGADERLGSIARLEGSIRAAVLRQASLVGVERLGASVDDRGR